MVGQSCVVKYTIPLDGLAAVLPQLAAPRSPGNDKLSYNPGSVNKPSLRIRAIRSFQEARSCGVGMWGFTSSPGVFWGATGGVLVGIDFFGQASVSALLLFGE